MHCAPLYEQKRGRSRKKGIRLGHASRLTQSIPGFCPVVVSAVCDILRTAVMERIMTILLVVTVIPMVAEAEHGFLGEAGELAQSRTFPALLPHQVKQL